MEMGTGKEYSGVFDRCIKEVEVLYVWKGVLPEKLAKCAFSSLP